MKLVYEFLKQLCINNNREWFTANKDFFEQAKLEFKDFVENLIPQIIVFDETVKDVKSSECIFRIYKDVRFSKDKSPYKTNMGAFITPEGRKSYNAGYYIHIEPDNSFTAGGIYMPPADKLLKIRQSIYTNPSEFKSIINNSSFVKHFGQVDGDKLKLAPKGFDSTFEDVELLKYKSYTVGKKYSDDAIQTNHFLHDIIKDFETMMPFNVYLNKIIR